jgi:flagellar biosynthesis anti-sigma factor FlgM
MKGITGNSALEAYRRVALAPVNPSAHSAPAANVGTAERSPAQAAKVSISAEARDLAVQGDAKVNQKKVDALKAKISDGSFQVNSQLVASRLLDTQG